MDPLVPCERGFELRVVPRLRLDGLAV